MRKMKRGRLYFPFTFGLIVGVTVYCSVIMYIHHPIKLNKQEERKLKYILFWTPFFSDIDYNFGFGREPFFKHDCPVTECLTTNNRTLVKMEEFDAIVFHSQDIYDLDLPTVRYPHQNYVFYTMESVQNDFFDFNSYPTFFNITMTYRRDSDIVLSYGRFSEKTKSSSFSSEEEESSRKIEKTELCVAFVSNCNTPSRREDIMDELQKYIDVDVYGKCGDKICSKTHGTKCKELIHFYKYYLAFENSLCPDYVTEKLYSALQLGVVPVVYGGANYTQFAPPNSYINVRDFSSIKNLAHYLLELSADEVEYNKYFKWKEKYYFGENRKGVGAFCKLCELLHKRSGMNSTVRDIRKWWREENPCENPKMILYGKDIKENL